MAQPFRLPSPAEVTAELLLCAQRSSEGRPGLVSKASPKPVQEGAGEVEVGVCPFLVPKVGKVPKGGTKSELSLTHIPFCCGCHPCVHARVCVCVGRACCCSKAPGPLTLASIIPQAQENLRFFFSSGRWPSRWCLARLHKGRTTPVCLHRLISSPRIRCLCSVCVCVFTCFSV